MGFGCYGGLLFLVAIILSSSFLSVQPQPICHDQEKSALLRFTRSFLIDCSLTGNSLAAYPRARPWLLDGETRSENCCEWDGVECDYHTGHVTGLDLGNSCLYGTFPSNSSLFTLSHLRKLNLAVNNFNYSRMPHDLGNLNKLTVLNLSSSWFSGNIPLEISKLSSLSMLNLVGNQDPITGDSLLLLGDSNLEKLVGNLTRLQGLHLNQVDLQSSVPNVLTNLTSLRVISLLYCNLFGEFPSGFFQLPMLEVVNLGGNKELNGTFPEFQQKNHLRELHLFLTGLSGELPPSIGRLSSLEVLLLWRSQFLGTVPSTVGNLTQLTNLNLAFNDFTGDIPLSITNLTHLNFLSLSRLKFRYLDLTTWLLKLNRLTLISLREMGLVGEVSSFLANLTQLTSVDLSLNQLTGSIPRWLGNLTQLTELTLDGNQLQGPIPPEICQLTNLERLRLSYNSGLFGHLDSFLKLNKLTNLALAGVNMMFPPNKGTNYSSLATFKSLELNACNLTVLPHFLQDQDELEELHLSGNKIHGDIPQWFLNIAKDTLLILDLSDNYMTGFEQPLVHIPWRSLEFLDFSSNKLQGPLPHPPRSMLAYRAADNHFAGLIPKQICKAVSLEVLDLSNNKLHGPIPRCIGDQLSPSLLVLNLRGNKLNGTIPQTHGKSCKLKMINLSENQLEGQLPRSLANCETLEVLDVGRITIKDGFPSWLGSILSLQVLVLRHNNFHGRVPSPKSGFVFPSLRIIDLSNNFHTGAFPYGYFQFWDMMKLFHDQNESAASRSTLDAEFTISGVTNIEDEGYNYAITITNKGHEMLYPKILSVFRDIDFSSNRFTGRIPDSIGNLQGLQALNLSNNNLQGGIPSSLSNMSGLESLDLSQNMFSGEIPQQLSQLTTLEVLNLSHNDLVGPIPQGRQFDTFDRSSFDGNPGLCGRQLSKECGNTDSAPGSPSLAPKDNQEQDSKIIDWLIRLLGCGSGFIVGFVVGKFFITDKYDGWFMETFGRQTPRQRRRMRRATRGRN